MKFSTIGIFAAVSWLGIQCQLVSTQELVVHWKSYNRNFLESIASGAAWKPAIAKSEEIREQKDKKNNQTFNCPNDLKTLTDLMLKDLPNYANRAIQKAQRVKKSVNLNTFVYVVTAGRAEFEPLPLNHNEYQPVFSESSEQVFFTTLDRQYVNGKAIESENYHWLFLTQTKSGWRMVMVFSQLGSAFKEQPPSPPRETSDGIIGQAVSLWLRDCRAGTIRTRAN